MKRPLALILLLGLGACNRHGVADVTLDAAATQRNATAAKTIADLQAATDAAQGPVPAIHDARPATAPKPVAATTATPDDEAAAPVDDAADAETNG